MDFPTIAKEIAASIMAGCAPGSISSHALMLDRLVSAYERFGLVRGRMYAAGRRNEQVACRSTSRIQHHRRMAATGAITIMENEE